VVAPWREFPQVLLVAADVRREQECGRRPIAVRKKRFVEPAGQTSEPLPAGFGGREEAPQ